MKKKKKLLSVSQLAKVKGVTRQGIRKAIVERRILGARKIGHQWVIEI